DGALTTFEVEAYLLEVERQLRDWPEKGQRVTRWMAPARAARLVSEDGLVELLLSLDVPPARRRRLLFWRGHLARVGDGDGTLSRVFARIARLWKRPKRRS
ncbi:MAG TPA: hypothetical protein VET85_09600, partial [Stellaceae bacterium]|nr:hypothetical protein [Stellaceae bacterium]